MPPRKKSIGKRSKSEKAILKKEKEQHLESVEVEKSVEPEIIQTAVSAIPEQDSKSKEKEHYELLSLFSHLNSLYRDKKYLKWEEKCWYNYVYKCREINPLILPEVNAYLTELDEDDACDIIHVFDECRKSEQMCEDIKFALLECPEITPKTQKSWIQSIKNLQFMMRKKMDTATFRILRAASEHINDETFNMEFGITDQSSPDPRFSFCLWGNLTKNLRHKGMNLPSTGFSFELPPELLKINCAVRIWHSMFDNVTPTFCESSVPHACQLGEVISKDDFTDALLEDIYSATDDQFGLQLEASAFSEILIAALKQIVPSETSGKSDTDKFSSAIVFTPPDEPEITILEKAEYFVVGGLYHFDLFQLPYQTVKSGCWIFTNWEEKELMRLPYRTSIIPIRHPKPDMSPAVAAEFADSEIKRFDKEMCSAISVSFKLPENVIFLEQPVPAFWVTIKKGFTTIGFFETKYDEDTGHIFFKTNQFGVIGFLQRKYNNMPYQSWELIKGKQQNTALLIITGMQAAIKIEISEEGCCIQQIERDGKSLFSNSYSVWMSPDALIKKLLLMGINVAIEKDINKFIEVSSKNTELENWTYSCMSVLTHTFNFYWSRWNAVVSPDQLVMRFNSEENNEKFNHVLMMPGKAFEIKCTESSTKFCDDPVEGQRCYSNAYHLLMDRSEQEGEKVLNFEFVTNVFFLLSSCKLFSCS
ncbi:dynein axonemal intermediate chain 7-like isoform X2 [Argiope bruennichi]|uniref:Protein CASC1 like protein n=1 Tax=Argiope bruennichi TaxID=94029 RepID=A0A8T0G7P2_ARGBR|nr:dynein axonemal intermediate chain 7-like isoform X2 [Argiope bruennichi]KAF8797303.1 Protein CASC1 like protein [Argiope bruennichi]